MSSGPSYVSSVLWLPSESDLSGSRTFDVRGNPVGNGIGISASSDVRAASTAGPPPAAVNRSDSYRVIDTYVGNDEERDKIREEEIRQANRDRELKFSWNWAITAWNVVACLLCPICVYCMMGALLCNIFAYVDHKSRDYEREKRKLQCALWWSIAFFAIGVVAIIIILIVLFTVLDAQNWNSIPTVPGSDFTM